MVRNMAEMWRESWVEARQLLVLGIDVQLHVPIGRRVWEKVAGKPMQKARGL